jgi:diguanylate cyclase (GGDEF)-like protein
MEEEKKNSLLIVDDENVNLKILVHILHDDYVIYTATNGANAVEKAKEFRPDLVLLDIVMPDMNGYETLSELKNYEETKNIPVIFITGLTDEGDEEKGLTLEAVDYITKPFRSTIVKLRVKHQIQILNQLRTIERLSMIDQLTSLPNRRNFDERLNMEWKQSIREKWPISLLMIDIDKFKNINDNYGHQQGDIILQIVARTFHKSFKRPSDFAARWGGEEFVVLLPNTPMDGALDVAERIRTDVEATDIFYTDGSKIRVTISIGVNSLVPLHDNSINEFISKADKALYAAKDSGRNKVVSIFNLEN